jgi:hypothetical protein
MRNDGLIMNCNFKRMGNNGVTIKYEEICLKEPENNENLPIENITNKSAKKSIAVFWVVTQCRLLFGRNVSPPSSGLNQGYMSSQPVTPQSPTSPS